MAFRLISLIEYSSKDTKLPEQISCTVLWSFCGTSCEANANIANSPREILKSVLRDSDSAAAVFGAPSIAILSLLDTLLGTNLALSSVHSQKLSVTVISNPQWRRATSSGLPCPSAHLHRQ